LSPQLTAVSKVGIEVLLQVVVGVLMAFLLLVGELMRRWMATRKSVAGLAKGPLQMQLLDDPGTMGI
jgi:hypothetical protein